MDDSPLRTLATRPQDRCERYRLAAAWHFQSGPCWLRQREGALPASARQLAILGPLLAFQQDPVVCVWLSLDHSQFCSFVSAMAKLASQHLRLIEPGGRLATAARSWFTSLIAFR
jgi:hypothetical protein